LAWRVREKYPAPSTTATDDKTERTMVDHRQCMTTYDVRSCASGLRAPPTRGDSGEAASLALPSGDRGGRVHGRRASVVMPCRWSTIVRWVSSSVAVAV